MTMEPVLPYAETDLSGHCLADVLILANFAANRILCIDSRYIIQTEWSASAVGAGRNMLCSAVCIVM